MKNRIKGLYAITPDVADTHRLLTQVERVLAGGASLLQYRNKQASTVLRFEQARALTPLCHRYDVPLIINDHVQLAEDVGADGVHLGGTDGGVAAARLRLGPDKIIGVSCYNRLELAVQAQAQGADYVAFGACFNSGTKPAAVRASLELFGQAKNCISLPTVAIGGITPENMLEVLAAGADSVAMISAIFGENPGDENRVAAIVEALKHHCSY